MMRLFLTTLFVLLFVDGLWLSFAVSRFYQPLLGHLFSPNIQIIPALLFYPMYALGLLCYVIHPALIHQHSLFELSWRAAFFGCIAYGTYNLTNQATLRDWPTIVTVVDTTWGATSALFISHIVYAFFK